VAEQRLRLDDYIAIIRRRKWQAIVPAFILFVIATLAALLIPPTYRSTASLLIEPQEIPPEPVRADQRIQVIGQRVMTTSNLSTLIERYDLYPDIHRREGIQMAVEEMRKHIKLDMISADVLDPQSGRPKASIAFSLSFEDGSASIAQQVTNELVSLFLNENLKLRAVATNEATTFLKTEAEWLGAEIRTLKARLETFKKESSDNFPELAALLRRAEERLRENEQTIRALQQQAHDLESELAQLSPNIDAPQEGGSIEAPLEDLQAHRVMGDQRALQAGANNPDYIRLHTKLDAVQIEIEALKALRVKLEEEWRAHEDRLTKATRVEQEYRALTRDYEHALSKYREIREKSLQAELAESLEHDHKGERLLLIEPPLVPETPYKPNRLAILMLGFALAIAGGLGNLALMERLDKGLYGTRAIRMATRIPLLAVVPSIETARNRQARLKRTYTLTSVILMLVLTATAVFHWRVMPLDVLWFVLMRRIDVAVPGWLN